MITQDEVDLSFACELLKGAPSDGKSADGRTTVSFLVGMLRHAASVVREGAAYGLSGHLQADGVRNRLEEMVRVERSDGVRAAVFEALYDGEDAERVRGDEATCGVWYDYHNRCHLPRGHEEFQHDDGDRIRWDKSATDSTVRPPRSEVRWSLREGLGGYEYYCPSCHQLRLFLKQLGRPSECGNCGSGHVVVDVRGSERLWKLRHPGSERDGNDASDGGGSS